MAWRFPLRLPALPSIDEAPCEAFNLMHILELPIVGHIKPNSKEQTVTPCVWHVRITWDALRNDSVTPGEASLDSWRASGSPSYRKSFPCGAHQGEEQSYLSHTQELREHCNCFPCVKRDWSTQMTVVCSGLMCCTAAWITSNKWQTTAGELDSCWNNGRMALSDGKTSVGGIVLAWYAAHDSWESPVTSSIYDCSTCSNHPYSSCMCCFIILQQELTSPGHTFH